MKKVKDLLKNNLVLGIIIGGVLFGSIGIVIATSIESEAILYSNEANENVTTVEEALNDLYSKAGTNNSGSSFISSVTIGGNTVTTRDNEVFANYDGDLYYHNGTITTTSLGIDDNNTILDAEDLSYRYSGPNPNNWVCFGYEDINNCKTLTASSNYAYRIIGFFDDNKDGVYNIKLIKNEQYGTYPWSGSTSNTSNNYNSSTLFSNILNGTSNSYLSSLGSNWQDMIITPTWNVGGCSSDDCYTSNPKKVYTAEMVTQGPVETNNTNKIGLMYISDAGYSMPPQYWIYQLNNSNYIENIRNNLSYIQNSTNLHVTISKLTGTNYNYVHATAGGYGDANYASYVIKPVFYLDTSVKIVSGDGTISDPFLLSL